MDGMTLHLDRLTASVAIAGLAEKGNDLAMLAQSLDEDWQRFGPIPSVPPGGETRHFISTMGNRHDSAPTGQTYVTTQLLAPHHVPAEKRNVEERWLRGYPRLTAEVTKVDDGYRLETAILWIHLHLVALLDWQRGHATFHILRDELPETLMAAATGRSLCKIVDIGHCGDLVAERVYRADSDELKPIMGQIGLSSIAIRTALPEWTRVEFAPIYEATP